MSADLRDDDLRGKVAALMGQAKDDLTELVAFRSVADPRQFPASECERAAEWVARACVQAGLPGAGLHLTPDGSTTVVARRPAAAGAPTVLLYCHYDVQPPMDEQAWRTPPWRLTESGGRWYGRGAADCKGNLVMHLTALRALGEDLRAGIVLVAEGSEEQGGDGLEKYAPAHRELLAADAIVIADTGNVAVGQPTFTQTLRGTVNVVVTVETLAGPLHSGMFGGAAPDALAALIQLLGTLRDAEGNTTVDGLASDQHWPGITYSPERFYNDAAILPGGTLLGSGSVAEQLWARPALTVLGIDCPPVAGSAAAIQPSARARLNLRIPPGITGAGALAKLTAHLESRVPWGARLRVEPEATGEPFRAGSEGPARAAMAEALRASYGTDPVTQGQGGSIPLCNVFASMYPDAEIMLLGVEEPGCLIHAPNESVDPSEIEHLAYAEALFLRAYGAP